jgi:hypothetical protein
MKRVFSSLLGLLMALPVALPRAAHAESQGTEYKGVQDPFGDPSNYEFSEDEKEDKEFFHLGRYIMLGIDAGVSIFTGGLGKTMGPGFYVGGRVLYFFDTNLALEGGIHYSNHLDSVHPSATVAAEIDTNMIPINVGLRYYFPVKNAPKAIAVANPYLVAGGGIYMRSQNVLYTKSINLSANQSSTSSFGAYGGGGVEFPIYRRHFFLGLDLRYHFVFFSDADDTWNGNLQPGDRAGNYFTTMGTITYSF